MDSRLRGNDGGELGKDGGEPGKDGQDLCISMLMRKPCLLDYQHPHIFKGDGYKQTATGYLP